MGGSSQAQDFENSGTSGGQGNLGRGFDTNQGNLGRGFDNQGGKTTSLLLSVFVDNLRLHNL